MQLCNLVTKVMRINIHTPQHVHLGQRWLGAPHSALLEIPGIDRDPRIDK
jgi:hypothetical protein